MEATLSYAQCLDPAAAVRAELEEALDRLLSDADRRLVWVEWSDDGGRRRTGHICWEDAEAAARRLVAAGYRDVALVDRRGEVGVWQAMGTTGALR